MQELARDFDPYNSVSSVLTQLSPLRSLEKKFGSFGVLINIIGCVLRYLYNDVVPDFGAPTIKKLGIFSFI